MACILTEYNTLKKEDIIFYLTNYITLISASIANPGVDFRSLSNQLAKDNYGPQFMNETFYYNTIRVYEFMLYKQIYSYRYDSIFPDLKEAAIDNISLPEDMFVNSADKNRFSKKQILKFIRNAINHNDSNNRELYHIVQSDDRLILDIHLLNTKPIPFHVQIDMADYGYRKLRAGKTYLITLDAHRVSELKGSVFVKVEPKNSKIIIDEQNYYANTNGTIELPIASGRHHYTILADNYTSQNGDFTIGKSEAKTLTIKLQPIMHEVLVGSNVGNARVFVDNLDYGGVGKLLIPQGNHTIRVQADGYVDEEIDVSINSYTGSLSFFLKENKKITHIHATPVTIYSNSSCIYKNNKKIKEWENGKPVMFMPGKYELSDDRGNTKKIVVGDEPMEVEL